MSSSRETALVVVLVLTWLCILVGALWFKRTTKHEDNPLKLPPQSLSKGGDDASSNGEEKSNSGENVSSSITDSGDGDAQHDLDDMPIDETSQDEALWKEAEQERDFLRHRAESIALRRNNSTFRQEKLIEFGEESKQLFSSLKTSLRAVSPQPGREREKRYVNAEKVESVLGSIQTMLDNIESTFQGDKPGENTAMTIVCNRILEVDGLDSLSAAKKVQPSFDAEAQRIIERIVPCIWSS